MPLNAKLFKCPNSQSRLKLFVGVEVFPTHLRSTAMGVTLAAARLGAILGNLVFALFLEVQCAVPILLVAALLIGLFKLF